jgi:hypothetical protein
LGGLVSIRAVISVINEVMTSLEESTPSAITARLPDTIPATIFMNAKVAFPIMPTHEAFCISCSRVSNSDQFIVLHNQL